MIALDRAAERMERRVVHRIPVATVSLKQVLLIALFSAATSRPTIDPCATSPKPVDDSTRAPALTYAAKSGTPWWSQPPLVRRRLRPEPAAGLVDDARQTPGWPVRIRTPRRRGLPRPKTAVLIGPPCGATCSVLRRAGVNRSGDSPPEEGRYQQGAASTARLSPGGRIDAGWHPQGMTTSAATIRHDQ